MRVSRTPPIAFGCALCGLLLAAHAQGATIYSYFYVAGQNSYTVAPNASVTVPLYLEEVNSDQSTNSLLKNQHGLLAASVHVSAPSGSSATVTGAAANTGTPPTGFDDPISTGTVDSVTAATITESTDPLPFGTDTVGVKAGTQSNGVSEIYLGTVVIHAGSSPGTTTFTVTSGDPVNGGTFTNDTNYDLDNSSDPLNPAGASSLYFSAASTNFSVVTTSVPEPTSSLLIGAIILWASYRFRRKVNLFNH